MQPNLVDMVAQLVEGSSSTEEVCGSNPFGLKEKKTLGSFFIFGPILDLQTTVGYIKEQGLGLNPDSN